MFDEEVRFLLGSIGDSDGALADRGRFWRTAGRSASTISAEDDEALRAGALLAFAGDGHVFSHSLSNSSSASEVDTLPVLVARVDLLSCFSDCSEADGYHLDQR